MKIGYAQNNMFYCDWSEEDFGKLCFNDLFGYLYRMKNGTSLALEDFPANPTFEYCWIPADLFEETVMTYFSVTPELLRSLGAWQEETGAYPYADNYLYYRDDIPDMLPMVTKRRENPDGTFTLCVAVSSLEMKTDQLFCHEVTIRPLENGGFQYVSNKITFLPEQGLPPNYSRLPAEIRP